MQKTTRRDLLQLSGAAYLGTLFGGPFPLKALAQTATQSADAQHDYSGWEQLYRDKWSWDKKTRGAHLINCTGACPHWVYSKNGIVIREEASKDMPALAGVPEYNPRGCNKGACGTDYLYGPHRVKYPLIRTGARGEGKWRRASWDEALGIIATKILDTIRDHAVDCISVYSPVPAVAPVSFSAGHRFANLTGAHVHTFFDWYGDHPTGQTQTCGVQGDTAETADWFNAKLVMLWGSSPAVTRIPDAHFLSEAALNGTRVVSITPDYNPSTIKADTWIHPKPGTDTALALGFAHVIIRDKLVDLANVKEQTDLPYLVRSDNKRFLREADVVEGGSPAKFYIWDAKTKKAVIAKGCWGEEPPGGRPALQPPFLGRNTLTFPDGTIALGDLDPALEGSFKVTLKDGKSVDVKPVYALYAERILRDYTPKKVSEITGVAEKTIVDVAKAYGSVKPAMIVSGGGTNHWYWSDIEIRAFHLLSSLTGNEGKNGGGVNHYIGQWKPVAAPGVLALSFPLTPARQRFAQTTIWTYVHADAYDAMETVGIDTRKYLRASLEQRMMPIFPREGRDPKVFIVYRGNFLNQAKGQKYVLQNLWPKLDLIVNLNLRMDSMALYSDIVLPAAHWYEKLDLNMTEEHTFINMTEPATPPMHESKHDWDVFALLAKKVQDLAVQRGMSRVFDEQFNLSRDFSTLYAQQTDNGKLETAEQAAQFILDNAPATKGMTLDMIRERPQRFKANWTSPIKEGVPYVPFQFYTANKKPWPTLTGRQQFYIDHDWFLEMGVELPVYKPPVDADAFPLRFNTPHSRHAIHSTFKDNVLMLRLQRGGPVLEMPPGEAKSRSLRDNDWAEVWNDHGRMICRVKIHNREPEGRVTMTHTPELYMDLIEGSTQSVCPIRINPTSLVGNYGHLVFRPNYYGPGGTQRDARVQVRRFTGVVPT
ncbi:MAG: molybdopterin-dependent oxidoreductase [Rhodoplanes sp.]|uniref:molybdopterin-dependent oxidoreductase n=1 Tax=Rhodoplanes sp. TaxID=1968906 RepID=UPI00179F7074|nr:molybdopterin-dependent oxidoreductase [Rhodoplanes sp.]NVO12420.1 molybdopterin-dependent oxidoreductase [Rhodoplanes sp.]